MNEEIFLSVVLPQYNEENNLRRGVLGELNDYLQKQPYLWEVIINDDESTDNSYALADEFVKNHAGFRLFKIKKGGKAGALNNGIKMARGEVILITDTDQSTPISEVEKLLPHFKQGFDVVIGSRGGVRENFSPLRKLASFVFRIGRQALVLHEIKDTQCGFKLFKADILKEVFPKLDVVNRTNIKGWVVSAFDVELLFMLKKAGCKIKEVPVKWSDEDTSTTKSRKFIKESLDMGKQILKVRWNWIKGKYNFGRRQKHE